MVELAGKKILPPLRLFNTVPQPPAYPDAASTKPPVAVTLVTTTTTTRSSRCLPLPPFSWCYERDKSSQQLPSSCSTPIIACVLAHAQPFSFSSDHVWRLWLLSNVYVFAVDCCMDRNAFMLIRNGYTMAAMYMYVFFSRVLIVFMYELYEDYI